MKETEIPLSKIEARFIRGASYFCLFWKHEPYPQSFICYATPKSVSKHFNCSKVEAYQLIEAKFRVLERQIQREITERKRRIYLINGRLKAYKLRAYRGKTVTRICTQCGSVFQTTYETARKRCDK